MKHCQAQRTAKGFSIIEAMVAMVLLSIGFIGVYALIGAADTYQSRAVARNNASLLVAQMFEVVEANRNDFITAVNVMPNRTIQLNSANNNNCDFGVAAADVRPVDFSNFNVFFQQWCQRLDTVLGNGTANTVRTIVVTNTPVPPNGETANAVTITLNQNDNNINITEVRLL